MVTETENQRFASPTILRSSRFLGVAFLLFITITGSAQTRTYIQKYRPLADSLSDEYGIPASVMLGVSIIESASGTSRNARLLNNFFGIVGKNNLMKTRGIKSRYKQYDSDTASFVGFCKLLAKKKYYKKLRGNMNYRLWTDAISKSGYSEVPSVWLKRVNDTIRKNKLASTR